MLGSSGLPSFHTLRLTCTARGKGIDTVLYQDRVRHSLHYQLEGTEFVKCVDVPLMLWGHG